METQSGLAETSGDPERSETRDQAMARTLWDENDLAIILDVKLDTLRHMKARGEIPGVVQINLRKWFVHRDAFLEHIRQAGMPKATPGRTRGSKPA